MLREKMKQGHIRKLKDRVSKKVEEQVEESENLYQGHTCI